jgi:type III secretory pathway component EscV
VLVYRIARNTLSDRVVANLQSLVDAQEATRSILYSSSLAQAVLDRLEVLEDRGDAALVLCGRRATDDRTAPVGGSQYWTFFGGPEPASSQPPLWVRNGQLYIGAALETAVPFSHRPYALVRVGAKADTASVKRYIDELRRKHALRREEFATSESETYRVYVARQMQRRVQGNVEALYGHHRMVTAVTPIAIEVASNVEDVVMLRADVETEFQRLVNGLRDDMTRRYGVRLPPVRVRSNAEDMPAGAYLFMINEVPLVMGTLERDKVFCDATAEQLTALAIPSTGQANPDDGSACAWVPNSSQAALEAAGVVVWTLSQYVVLHLKAVLRSNLREFMGVHDIVEALRSEGPAGLATAQRLGDHPAGFIRFRGVVTSLLDEQLQCGPMGVLANRYLELSARPSYEIVEQLRCGDAALSSITQDAARWKVYTLAPGFVESIGTQIVREGDAAVLALEPELAQEALSAVRSAIGPDQHDGEIPVILVEDWQIRPFVRKLIELEFPHVRVVARRETLAVDARVLEPVSAIALDD